MNRYDPYSLTLHGSDVEMHYHESGEYVFYEDYKAKIDLAIDVLTNLKNVNLKNTSADELNTIVSQAVEDLR